MEKSFEEFCWKGEEGLRSWQRNLWNRLCFGDLLGNIRACFFVDVFDPIQADIMMQEKMETVLVEGFLNKQGRQDLMHKAGLALEETSVHLLEHIPSLRV